jgi:hypothetical protein
MTPCWAPKASGSAWRTPAVCSMVSITSRSRFLRSGAIARYAIQPGHCYLFSSSRKFAEAAGSMGINATALTSDKQLMQGLRTLLKELETVAG